MPRPSKDKGFSLIELLVVLLITLVIAGFAIPKVTTVLQNLRSGGDGRSLSSEVALAKMRAASNYTQTRVYADLTANTFELDLWNSATSTWSIDANTSALPLSKGVTYGYGTLSGPPSNTQSALGQAPLCAVASGSGTVANTTCIVFNSRGIPIDSTGAPYGDDALYITDGSGVYGVTISAAGLIQNWRSDASTTSWKKR